MSEDTVIRCCAPTLAGIMTGSIFNCAFSDLQDMLGSLRKINRCLTKNGVCAIALRYRDGKALIYLYRPTMLERDLDNPVASGILNDLFLRGGGCRFSAALPVVCLLRMGVGRLANGADCLVCHPGSCLQRADHPMPIC